MKEMHWSWDQLQEAPPYVRRFCADFNAISNQIQADKNTPPGE